MATFWQELDKPIVSLAPMDGVTDFAFREIHKKYGQAPLLYTEFVSVEGIVKGASRLLKDFAYSQRQRPIIAQIFGTTPQYFRQIAIVLAELGFDGIDINMGCPAKNVAQNGAGAGLIQTPHLAQDLIRAVKQGVTDWNNGATLKDCPDLDSAIIEQIMLIKKKNNLSFQEERKILPVSVKTRLGYSQKQIKDWLPYLLETQPVAIAIHGRTLKQGYSGQADWQEIATAVDLAKNSSTLILGNGDVLNYQQALIKVNDYGVDGVLIGRGALGNPYVYKDNYLEKKDIFEIALEHAKIFQKVNPDGFFLPMRKHLGWYVKNIPQASKIRQDLFKVSSFEEVQSVFVNYNLIKV